MITADVGVPALLLTTLFDGAATRGVRAYIRTISGAPITTVSLVHTGDGTYQASYTHGSVGYLSVTYYIFTDTTYTVEDKLYARASEVWRIVPVTTPASIADAVWDEGLAFHLLPGSTGEALNNLSGLLSSSAIADAVWNDNVFLHSIPATFGDYVQVIRQFVIDNNSELVNPVWGLNKLYAEIQQQHLLTRTEINVNETKIDNLYPYINVAKNDIINEVNVNEVKIDALSPFISAAETNIISEINTNEIKLDNLALAVASIQNNTTVRFIVPEYLVKPTSGVKTYQFHLRLFDTVGNPEAPDSTPTIRIRRLDTAVDIINGALMTQDGVKIGAYYYDFPISAGTAEYPALVEVTVVEGGITRYVPATTEVTEFQSDLNAIQAQLTAVQSTVTSTNTSINNPTYGLSALNSGQAAITGEINQNELLINQVKAKTNNLPVDPASETNVSSIGALVLTRPDINTIQTRLNLLEQALEGPDGRNMTDVYNQIDFTPIAKTADPRFNNLDAAISTRSTLTAADVWTYVNRTLTGFILPNSEIDKIWDYLGSQATTVGSLGKKIADFLDTTVSSRATGAQVTAALAGVAQEVTVNGLYGHVSTEANQNQLLLNSLIADMLLVKGKTNNLPVDPARESTLINEATQIDSGIAALSLLITGIKNKTDNLPPDPAKETSVQQRPTNPVLTTDLRLNKLDANISTRATPFDISAALAGIATSAQLSSGLGIVVNEVNQNEAILNTLSTLSLAIKAKTDTLPAQPASKGNVDSSEAAILAAIAGIPAPGGISAADVWTYGTRLLTDSRLANLDALISSRATPLDITNNSSHQYNIITSTTFKNISGDQEVIVWIDKDGARVTSAINCNVNIKNSSGISIWGTTLASPNSDGVFKFTNAVTLAPDENYYIVVSITVGAQVYTTQKPFFTVG